MSFVYLCIFCSHGAHIDSEDGMNISMGPGIHKWYLINFEHVSRVYKAAALHGCDIATRSTFVPPKSWLMKENIPVHKIIQKPGDIVWIPAGCMHWTKAKVFHLFYLLCYNYL